MLITRVGARTSVWCGPPPWVGGRRQGGGGRGGWWQGGGREARKGLGSSPAAGGLRGSTDWAGVAGGPAMGNWLDSTFTALNINQTQKYSTYLIYEFILSRLRALPTLLPRWQITSPLMPPLAHCWLTNCPHQCQTPLSAHINSIWSEMQCDLAALQILQKQMLQNLFSFDNHISTRTFCFSEDVCVILRVSVRNRPSTKQDQQPTQETGALTHYLWSRRVPRAQHWISARLEGVCQKVKVKV